MTETLPTSMPRRVNTQQVAWGVILLSFAIFCAILIFVIIGANYFVFQSRVPLDATIHVSRGTATVATDVNETAVKGDKSVDRNSVVATDPQSQASLTFLDPQHKDRLLATITLKNGSSLSINEDSRPRFDWSQDAYWIEFEEVYGAIDIFVPDGLDRPLLVTFKTTLGPSVRLTAAGRYTLSAGDAQVQLINYTGEALLMASDLHNRLVPAGQTASIQANAETTAPQFDLAPLTNLVGDTAFSANNVVDFISNTDQVQPQVWRCLNLQDTEPAGSFNLTTEDSRPAIRLYRDDGAESHGVTRCLQGLGTGTEGLDVSSYKSVSIRATFKIVSQSLSTCGNDGSECPFMLQMDYVPVNGGDSVSWFHGFYAFVDPTRFMPLNCASCNEQHEQINPNVWYTYESHNLKEIFAPERVPQAIFNLRFYASGHEYEVYVSEVALLVD